MTLATATAETVAMKNKARKICLCMLPFVFVALFGIRPSTHLRSARIVSPKTDKVTDRLRYSLTGSDRSPPAAPPLTTYYTMTVRGRVTVSLMIFLSFVAFASYHKGTGSTAWLQWLTLVIFLFFGYVFDSMFTNAGSFMFDPDADNWRRKTDALGR